MKTHHQVVAALHIAMGAMMLFAALIIFAIFGLAAGIKGASGEHQAAGIVGVVGILICGLLVLLGLPGIIGGWALLAGRSWGRILLLVLGILDLPSIPFGTALGIYTLWALTHETPAAAP